MPLESSRSCWWRWLPMTRKIAIACQGGAAHTAFTAGVLGEIVSTGVFDRSDLELVGISGTSGGAICSAIVWYGYLKFPPGPERGRLIAEQLDAFWTDNEAASWWDAVTNAWAVGWRRLQEAGVALPAPAVPGVQQVTLQVLRDMLQRRIDYDHLPELLATRPDHPTLYVGAVDALRGEFLVFEESCPDPTWRRADHAGPPPSASADPVLASAAMVPVLPSVTLPGPDGARICWDGLYAYNPAVRCMVECEVRRRPDEIWVIQIDPQEIDTEPRTPAAIADRKFELSSNLSLNGELHWIRQVNAWIDMKVLDSDQFKPIRVARIPMTKALSDRLDLASKSDRAPARLRELIDDGKAQAARFLADRETGNGEWWYRDFPRSYPRRALLGSG